MKKINNYIIISIFVFFVLGLIIPQSYALYSIPPTPAIKKIKTSNGTVTAKNYTSTFEFVGNGISIKGSNSGQKIYFNVNATNNSTKDTNTAQIVNLFSTGGQGLGIQKSRDNATQNSLVSIICSGLTCTENGTSILIQDVDSGGSGSATYDTFQNIGKGGHGFYSGNNTKTNFQFRNLTSIRSDLIIINHNTTDVTLSSTLKLPNKDCGTSNFFQSLTNTSGFTCANGNLGTITTGNNVGKGGKGFFKDVSPSSTMNFRNLTSLTPSTLTISQNLTDVMISALVSDTNTAQIKNADNAVVGLFGSRTNATQNTIKTLTGSNGITFVTNTTDVRINQERFQNNTGTNVGTSGSSIYTSNSGSVLQFLKLICVTSGCTFSANSTNVILTIPSITDTNTAQIGNSDNGESIFGSRQNATKNLLKTFRNGTGISLPYNTTSITVTNTGVIQVNGFSGKINITRTFGNSSITNTTGTINVNLGWHVLMDNGSPQRVQKTLTLTSPVVDGIKLGYIYKSSSYTGTGSDFTVELNSTSASTGIFTLPDATTFKNNTFLIKKADYSNKPVTIKTTSNQLIDGFKNMNLTNAKDFIQVQSNGTDWRVIDQTAKDEYSFFAKGTNMNKWYSTATINQVNATFAVTAGHLYAVQYKTGSPIKIDQMRIGVVTAGATSLCRVGIYTDNGTAYPAYIVANSDVGTLTTSTLGIKTNTFANPLFLQGNSLYWLVLNCQATAPSLTGLPVNSFVSVMGQTNTRMGSAFIGTGWDSTRGFSPLSFAFPSNATATTGIMPMIQIRILG